MSTYSLAALLKKLETYRVLLGWGALAVFSRHRINRMLEQQFTAAFTASRFIRPCSGEVDGQRLDDIVFGAPVLSFERADLGSAVATLSLPLLAGRYAKVEAVAGRSPTVVTKGPIASDAVLTLDIDLEQVISDSDNTGRIAFDMRNASNPICTLDSDPLLQQSLGAFLLEHLRAQPRHQTTYVLAVVDAGNYAPLNPVKFSIRTQPAPGAKVAGARNAGDGAVLVFMKLRGYDNDAVTDPDDGFPYLLPNDTQDGAPMHTAAMFVERDLAHFINDDNLAVLYNSVLPAGYAFAQSSRHQPNDFAMFGRLEATRSNVSIEPPVSSFEGLDSLDFTARWGDGSSVAGVNWSVGCLNGPLSPGQISSSGRYTDVSYPFGVPSVRMTTVTARYTDNGQQAEASAFLLVRSPHLTVEPLVVSSTRPGVVPLLATGYAPGPALNWTLLGNPLGKLLPQAGGGVHYETPPAGGVPLYVQRVAVDLVAEDQTAQAAVILLHGTDTLPVEPPFVGQMFGQGELSFQVPQQAVDQLLRASGASEDEVMWRWSVVGEGTVTGEGRTARFTPPATSSAELLSVLVCEMVGPEVDYACGYAAVQMVAVGAVREVPRWEELLKFEITAPDGVEAYANGMQQIRVQIRIETKTIDLDGEQVAIPISDVELASLSLVHLTSNTEVPFVDPLQDGIDHGDRLEWAASDRRNRFNLYQPTAASEKRGVVPESGEGVRYRDLYLHLKTDQSVEFYAQFQADDGRIIRSVDEGEELESITVKGVQQPAIGLDDYRFERNRVWNGEGDIEGDDDFTYMLQSIDFWTLNFNKDGYGEAGFATLKIEGNTSTIQWESELLDEIFFSCTGYVFSPKHRLQPVAPTQLSFDPYLGALMTAVSHPAPDSSFHSQPPSPGQLVVSLHREMDVTYWYDGQAEGNIAKLFRRALDGPVTYTLRDENGNRHNLQIGFRDRSLENSRNSLHPIIQ